MVDGAFHWTCAGSATLVSHLIGLMLRWWIARVFIACRLTASGHVHVHGHGLCHDLQAVGPRTAVGGTVTVAVQRTELYNDNDVCGVHAGHTGNRR